MKMSLSHASHSASKNELNSLSLNKITKLVLGRSPGVFFGVIRLAQFQDIPNRQVSVNAMKNSVSEIVVNS